MPTLLDAPIQVTKNKYFPGRPLGAKNKHHFINVRKELERVYEKMGGFDGLYQYAVSAEGRPKFYEWFVKIFASFELKQDDIGKDPIRVIVYGNDGTHVEIGVGNKDSDINQAPLACMEAEAAPTLEKTGALEAKA